MHAPVDELRRAFRGGLLTGADDVAPHLIDWRKTWRGVAIGVAMPESVEDVAAVVRWCAAKGVAVVPQGGNTGQSGGSVPRATGDNLVLSLSRLTRVRSVDATNNTMTVDAGCILQDVQAAADAVDRLFPLSLGAEGSCTIGGNLATNAGGTAVLRYGNARDLCLGLEVVTARGDIWNGLKGLRKDNSGYDLRDLFIGSEGSLGVITGAVLRLFTKPTARVTAFAGVADPASALMLLECLQMAHDQRLTAFEMMSDACMELMQAQGGRRPLAARHAWYVLVELSDMGNEAALRDAAEASLGTALEAGVASDVAIAETLAQAKALWALREGISAAQGREGRAIKHDIAVRVSDIAAFVEEALAAVGERYPAFRPVVFGHVGDGNLHFNFSSAKGADQDAFMAQQDGVNRIVHDVVRRYDGTISAEHGLGVLRRDEADAHRGAVERGLMAAVKQALDPDNVMNPDKVISV